MDMTLDKVEADVAMMNSDQKLSWLCTRTFSMSQDVMQLLVDVDYLKKNRHCPNHAENERKIRELAKGNRRAIIAIAAIVLGLVGAGVIPFDVLAKILSLIGA
jgi:hypothetical protein